ncbi:hypothetical protein FZ983_33075 [Azospirillum sp. B21]|uniref:hypothetical protein n=1 Tax=Azospirillum sp. B21 TaxID=2607496 RepID=UPI0011ED5FAB|nr:hypothetical protein [Azospirillum sp. B21]KAA0571653.1 hypothetical protein FZ983_33075 [Azospirillum sp. B21]
MRIKTPTTKAVPTITEPNEDAEAAEAWANNLPVKPAKKRSQPKRKTPPKVLRSYRLPQLLLNRIGLVSHDISLPEYTVVELLLNEALAARGIPKTLDKPG